MQQQDIFDLNDEIFIKMIVNTSNIQNNDLSLAVSVKDKNGIDLIVSTTQDNALSINTNANKIEAIFHFPNYLATGEYILVAAVEDRSMGTPQYYDYIEGACYFKSEISQPLFGIFHQPVKQLITYQGV
jgi:lipopolysaccharide transport system ATP-binding protein